MWQLSPALWQVDNLLSSGDLAEYSPVRGHRRVRGACRTSPKRWLPAPRTRKRSCAEQGILPPRIWKLSPRTDKRCSTSCRSLPWFLCGAATRQRPQRSEELGGGRYARAFKSWTACLAPGCPTHPCSRSVPQTRHCLQQRATGRLHYACVYLLVHGTSGTALVVVD